MPAVQSSFGVAHSMTVSLNDRLGDELDEVLDDTEAGQNLVQPTADEARNGWTADDLTKYIASREAGAALAVDPHSLHRRMSRRPREQNHRYSPHRWRG